MSKDGFLAYLRVNEIEFASGYHGPREVDGADCTLMGSLREAADVGFTPNFTEPVAPDATLVVVRIEFMPRPVRYYEAPEEFEAECIGHVRYSGSLVQREPAEKRLLRADVNLALPTDHAARFFAMREHLIQFSPVFLRTPNKEKIIIAEDQYGPEMYISRAYFIPELQLD